MTLGRDIVDDQDIVDIIARCPDEQVPYSTGWGSREATAWRSESDIRQPQVVTRDLPPPDTAWAPHPGPPAAVGQEVLVAEGVKPAWGALGNGTRGQSANTRARDQVEPQQRQRSNKERRGNSGWIPPAELMRDSRFFEQPQQRSQSNQSHSNQRSHSHHSSRDARATKAREGNGKWKLASPNSSDDDRASVRSQSASGHESQRSYQRSQRDHFNYGGKGNQPARDKGRYDRANAYFTEQGSFGMPQTHSLAILHGGTILTSLRAARPTPPPVVLRPTAKQRRKPRRRCTTIVPRQRLLRRLRERMLS